jgi:hypothetical protein
MKLFLSCIVVCVFAFLVVGCIEPDVPDVLPEGHHVAYKDYQGKVVIDPHDEDWTFYTDTEPTFSLQATDEGNAQTVVCMENVRQEDGRQDRYYTGKYCAGGEGKIQIIQQGSQIIY